MKQSREPELISIEEASKRINVSSPTLRRRIASGELAVFIDGKDRRRRLVSIEDLEQVFAPQLLVRAA